MFPSAQTVLVTGGTFVHAQGNIQYSSYNNDGSSERNGTSILHKHVAHGAFHNSSERYDAPKCRPGTRAAILAHITTWIRNRNHMRLFMWLYGLAGAGKSAIAQTIAQLCEAENLLLASFFFSRTAGMRNTTEYLISTIAYQLTVVIPELKDYVATAIERDPLIFTRSLDSQILALIVAPLKDAGISMTSESSSTLPRLMLFDGLDECGTEEMQIDVIGALKKAINLIPIPILILVCSRQEYHILEAFNAPELRSITEGLALDDRYEPDKDIQAYLTSEFEEIKKQHPSRKYLPKEWPSSENLNTLVKNASGLFIYASIVTKYIKSRSNSPQKRLDNVLSLRSTVNGKPFEQLDALYSHVLASVEDLDTCLTILGFIILSSNLKLDNIKADCIRTMYTPREIEDFLGYERGTVLTALVNLHSIIQLPDMELDPRPDKDTPAAPSSDLLRGDLNVDIINHVTTQFFHDFQKPTIHLHHTSLRDFLLDQSRSNQYFIDADMMHSNITRRLMEDSNAEEYGVSDSVGPWFGSFFSPGPKIIFFLAHCPGIRAIPSLELTRELYHFDIGKQFDRLEEHYRRCYNYLEVLTYWDNFLSWLRNQNLSYAGESLYTRHTKQLDSWIQTNIARYPEPLSSLLPAVIMLDQSRIRYMKTIFNILMFNLNPQEVKETFEIDKCSFCFDGSSHHDDVNFEKGASLLRTYFSDSSRAGDSCVSPDRYLALTEVFINFLLAKEPRSNYCHMPHLLTTNQVLHNDSGLYDILDLLYFPHPHRAVLALLPSVLELAPKSPSMVTLLIQNVTQYNTIDDFQEERYGAAVAARKYIDMCGSAPWEHVHQPGYDFCIICEDHTTGVNILDNFTPPRFVATLDQPYTDDFETTLENIKNELTLKHILGEALHGPYFYLSEKDYQDARSIVFNRQRRI